MKYQDAIRLAEELVDNDVKLSKYESDFVQSLVKICRKPEEVTLTDKQTKLLGDVKEKLLLKKVANLAIKS